MRIFLNDKNLNKQEDLAGLEPVRQLHELWRNIDVLERSSIDLKHLITPFGSISLLYGPRQIGKTATLLLFLSTLKDSDTLVFTDCSTIVNKADLAEHLRGVIHKRTTIVLDEVQAVEGWHLALRSLFTEGLLANVRLWCTGSEARHLLEGGERLPGRKGKGKVLFARPWSFREYMDFFYSDWAKKLEGLKVSHMTQSWLDDLTLDWAKPWNDYLKTGGIPRVVAEYHQKNSISDDIYRIYEDWIMGTWSQLRTPERSLRAFCQQLIGTMNSRVSFDALKKNTDIQSPNTIRSLTEMQEDHFSLRVIPRFNLDKQTFQPTKLKKIYPLDPFIARIFACAGKNIRRHYSENCPKIDLSECAFAAQTLRREAASELSYLYVDKSQTEVDFFFESTAFELKTTGEPTAKQLSLLKRAPHSLVIHAHTLPHICYLLGEGR